MTPTRAAARDLSGTGAALPTISLWQPYASLVACGAKPFETRHWRAPDRLIGRRIAIHVAKRRPTRAELDGGFDDVADTLGICDWHLRVPYGAVICTTMLADCAQVVGISSGSPCLSNGSIIKDDGFGDYALGRFCWRLDDVETFDPVSERGRQGWWQWSPPLRRMGADRG